MTWGSACPPSTDLIILKKGQNSFPEGAAPSPASLAHASPAALRVWLVTLVTF